MDNSPEFVAKISSECGQILDIIFQYIKSGKPKQNVFIECFNRSYRGGVLNK